MQAALEAGQLNRVSDMLGISPSDIVAEGDLVSLEEDTGETGVDEKDDSNNNDDNSPREYNDWDDLYYDDWSSEDSV